MILERLVSMGKKVHDDGRYKIILFEEERWMLFVRDNSGGHMDEVDVAMIDMNTGELGTMQVDQSLSYDIDSEMNKMVKYGLRLYDFNQMRMKQS